MKQILVLNVLASFCSWMREEPIQKSGCIQTMEEEFYVRWEIDQTT